MVAKFAYDGWNPAKPTPIGTENFDVWADLDSNGSLTTRYLHDDAVDALFARIDQSGGTGTGYYYLTDRLGSIREVAAAASGTVLDAITYDGFGKIASETNSTYRGRYAWTGRELDAEIDLQYNRARYYDASTGRWISQDPLGFDAGDGNLYRYVRNAPTVSTDASGFIPVLVDKKLVTDVSPKNLKNLDNGIGDGTSPYSNLVAKLIQSFSEGQLEGSSWIKDNNVKLSGPNDEGWLTGETGAKGNVPKGATVWVSKLIIMQWDLRCNKEEPTGLQVLQNENVYYTEGGAKPSPPKEIRDPEGSPIGEKTISAIVKLKNGKNGATHRVIFLDAPGMPVPKLAFMGIPPPSFVYQVMSVSELKKVDGNSAIHFNFKMESKAGKVTINVNGKEGGEVPIR